MVQKFRSSGERIRLLLAKFHALEIAGAVCQLITVERLLVQSSNQIRYRSLSSGEDGEALRPCSQFIRTNKGIIIIYNIYFPFFDFFFLHPFFALVFETASRFDQPLDRTGAKRFR